MKNRIIQLKSGGSSFLYDRDNLIEGYTSNNVYIPKGGVIVNNKYLSGYILDGGGEPKWEKIGKISYAYDIPKYYTQNYEKKGGSKNVNLKKAIKILRNYYDSNIN